jgi:prepilin-type N-terminal cleavage/methylation domain-containing protein
MTARSLCRRAFTLVEMLIAMALTLILVYAIAEFYAYLGDSVKDGRAMIELAGGLRSATERLKADFALMTCTVEPWKDDGAVQGYFTYSEGYRGPTIVVPLCASDQDANRNGLPDATEDANSNSTPDFNENNVTTLFGDSDDFLAMTIRTDGPPLVGGGYQVLADGTVTSTPYSYPSNLAEVAWWTGFTDQNANGTWDIGESRLLHRRQLIINPSLNVIHQDTAFVDGNNNPIPYFFRLLQVTTGLQTDYEAMQMFDVSITQTGAVLGGYRYYVANSLSDLTRRENRFMIGNSWAQAIDLDPFTMRRDPGVLSIPQNRGVLARWVQGFGRAQARKGDDVVLSNVLAFDVRVYDPQVPLYADDSTAANARTALQPGDPYWLTAATNNHPIIGRGAYVDIGYDSQAAPTGIGDTTFGHDDNWDAFDPANAATDDRSHFSSGPHARAGVNGGVGRIYDTWARSYERDGVNEDQITEPMSSKITDEGTDGLDNDGINGVDDPGERETSPPYPHPLRGIQVRIRVYEPSSRQMRQATVGHDFIPE